MANLLLSVVGAIAEFERQLIRERQREGITLAKARGVYTGRPATLKGEVLASLMERLKAGEKPSELAREYKISRMTLHRYKTKVDRQEVETAKNRRRAPQKGSWKVTSRSMQRWSPDLSNDETETDRDALSMRAAESVGQRVVLDLLHTQASGWSLLRRPLRGSAETG